MVRDAGPYDSEALCEPGAFHLFGLDSVTPQTKWQTPHRNANLGEQALAMIGAVVFTAD